MFTKRTDKGEEVICSRKFGKSLCYTTAPGEKWKSNNGSCQNFSFYRGRSISKIWATSPHFVSRGGDEDVKHNGLFHTGRGGGHKRRGRSLIRGPNSFFSICEHAYLINLSGRQRKVSDFRSRKEFFFSLSIQARSACAFTEKKSFTSCSFSGHENCS